MGDYRTQIELGVSRWVAAALGDAYSLPQVGTLVLTPETNDTRYVLTFTVGSTVTEVIVLGGGSLASQAHAIADAVNAEEGLPIAEVTNDRTVVFTGRDSGAWTLSLAMTDWNPPYPPKSRQYMDRMLTVRPAQPLQVVQAFSLGPRAPVAYVTVDVTQEEPETPFAETWTVEDGAGFLHKTRVRLLCKADLNCYGPEARNMANMLKAAIVSPTCQSVAAANGLSFASIGPSRDLTEGQEATTWRRRIMVEATFRAAILTTEPIYAITDPRPSFTINEVSL